MKTKLIKSLLFLVALTSITGAHADESIVERIKYVFKEPHVARAPAVAAVRG